MIEKYLAFMERKNLLVFHKTPQQDLILRQRNFVHSFTPHF